MQNKFESHWLDHCPSGLFTAAEKQLAKAFYGFGQNDLQGEILDVLDDKSSRPAAELG